MKKMKFKTKTILIFFIVLYSSLLISGINNVTTVHKTAPVILGDEKDYSEISAEYLIDSDDDFVTYGFSGKGTQEEPFIISNLEINTAEMYGIYINNVSSYFIIENCFIRSSYYGLKLYNVKEDRATISNNIFYKSVTAIEVEDSEYVTIVNNNITENIDFGITIIDSPNINLTSNYFYKNGYRYSGTGLVIIDTLSATIRDNIFILDGISVIPAQIGDENIQLINNSVNGKEIGYFSKENDIIIEKPVYGQIIINQCSNVKISNQNITDTNVAITVYDSNNVELTNNTIVNTDKGITIYESSSINVNNNTLSKPKIFGIEVYRSSSFVIKGNVVEKSRIGLFLFGGDFSSPNITQNSFLNNEESGIDLIGTAHIYISENIFRNNLYGLRIFDSTRIEIHFNTFDSNSLYAISLNENTRDIIVYHNSFINNAYTTGTAQCKDDGTNNYWYNAELKQGNFWSDLEGKTYLIDGAAGSEDLYPFEEIILTYPPLLNQNYKWLLLLLLFIPLVLGMFLFYRKKNKRKEEHSGERKESKRKKKNRRNAKSSTQTILNKQIQRQIRGIFTKWFLIGTLTVLVLSSSVFFYKLTITPEDNGGQNNYVNYAQALQSSIPEASFVEIIGNATNIIHESLIDAFIERVEPEPNLTWLVTANVLKFDNEGREYLEQVTFTLNNSVIIEIGQNLFDSLNNTEILGTYGEEPYDDANTYNLNIKWGLRFFLENHTIIELTVLENGLVVYAFGEWTSLSNYSTNMIGALIIGPETAFDNTISVLREIFEENIN